MLCRLLRDAITPQYNAQGLGRAVNAGRAQVWGLSLADRHALGPALSLRWRADWLQARDRGDGAHAGRRLPGRPQWQAHAQLDWQRGPWALRYAFAFESGAYYDSPNLLPAPVLVWSCTPQDPGYYLPAEDCTVLAAYEVARYACYRPVWLLGGDGEYRGEHAQKWREVGRAVFGDSGQEIVTMHPRGVNWPNEDLRQEPWLSFLSYQSGHGDSDEHLRWLTQGPPASNWDNPPRKPVINQEPNYEHHLSYHQRQEFNDFHVRRAAYWSLLVTPPAGVTYGHHGVWPWMEEPGVPLDHNRSGVAPTWREALSAPGAASMTHLHDLFRQMDWWTLRPAQNLLYEQPGETDPSRFVAIAASQDGNLTVAYTPAGQPVALRDFDPLDTTTSWYDPSLGAWHEAPLVGGLFPPPDGRDWLLVIRREG